MPSRHTRILGENYASCSVGNAVDKTKVTQIFGGFGVGTTLNLAGARYVDVQCLEITGHNGRCIFAWNASVSERMRQGRSIEDDYDSNGVGMSNTTSNILLQNLWIHGPTTRAEPE
jgi:hypothetical protein